MKQYGYAGYIEMYLMPSDVRACVGDVRAVIKRPYVRRQLDRIRACDRVNALRDTGTWKKSELRDRVVNEERLVWLLACNIIEGEDSG